MCCKKTITRTVSVRSAVDVALKSKTFNDIVMNGSVGKETVHFDMQVDVDIVFSTVSVGT